MIKVNPRLYNCSIISETLDTIDGIGINHNHNRLFWELINSKIYQKHLELFIHTNPLFFKNKSQKEIWQWGKETIYGLEETITKFHTIENSNHISWDLLEPILALAIPHFNADLGGIPETTYSEYCTNLENGKGLRLFRFGINKPNNISFIPMVENLLNYISENKGYKTEKVKELYKATQTFLKGLPTIWGCIEAGLNKEALLISDFILGLIDKDPSICDSAARRRTSLCLAKGSIYLSIGNKLKAIEAFEVITSLFYKKEGDSSMGQKLYSRVAQTRAVEASIQLYKLDPTTKRAKICTELFIRSLLPNFISGHDSDAWEAVRERIIITYMLAKYVYGYKI